MQYDTIARFANKLFLRINTKALTQCINRL